ncbi:MAG: hypothetical protein K8R73_07090 [Clostridiales bacterium]|nr:hypothetical protein [Clostridiales bacterium]
MNWVDLPISNLEEDKAESCSLSEAIRKESLVILLGSPGSGKTSLLEKYQNENPKKTQLLPIRVFLRPRTEAKKNIEVLLLDGLDEFRCISNVEKTSVIIDLAEKINDLEIQKIVISCREMDWYGESDVESLQEIIKKKVSVFRILPLDRSKQFDFAQLFKINEIDSFIEKFSGYGFLENPQLFGMLDSVYKTKPETFFKSKKELFEHFFSISRESNETYKRNKVYELEASQILKLSGYCAAFLFFCSFDNIGDEFLDSICEKEKGFPKNELEKVLKTSLFSKAKGGFIHRTLAEFSLANFILTELISDGNTRSLKKIMNLFVKDGRIPTELRGTYAWLCSLSENMDLIKVDPYYQAIHGDNSLLNDQQKKSIILQVKEYAKSNPYFFRFEQKMDLEGFYNKELDSFLVKELSESFSQKNHYCYFVTNAIVTSPNLSKFIKDHLRDLVLDTAVPGHIKSTMLQAFVGDIDFLCEALKKIRDGILPDSSDRIKERILIWLYPQHINMEKIVDYLLLYRDRVGGHCYYLYKTHYKEKFALIDRIFQSCVSSKEKGRFSLPPNVEGFVSDYFLETCLLFMDTKNPLTSKEIFRVIKHFKGYYESYEPLKIRSYRYAITEKEKISDVKLTRLGDELFSLYVDDVISKDHQNLFIYDFHHFYSLKTPGNPTRIILSKMSPELSAKTNNSLFSCALGYAKGNPLMESELIVFAEKFGFEKELENWRNPPKRDWEIKREKKEKEEEVNRIAILNENEAYFSRPDFEIQSTFKDLDFIAKILFLDDDEEDDDSTLSVKTKDRLTRILKKSIHFPTSPELLSVKSLAESSPKANRNIDIVYYVSCSLNSDIDFSSFEIDYLKYLYLICILNERVSNVIKGNFSEKFESTGCYGNRLLIKIFHSVNGKMPTSFSSPTS